LKIPKVENKTNEFFFLFLFKKMFFVLVSEKKKKKEKNMGTDSREMRKNRSGTRHTHGRTKHTGLFDI
jgi:hypothetical protein